MLPGFIFHHIGVAVLDIEATANLYVQGGYHRSSVIFDPIQNINVCWLTKEGSPTIELLAPVDDKSPVKRILEKNGVTPYHFCYSVDNIESAVKELKGQGYLLISKPVEAVAIRSSRICFLFNKNIGLIELVEAPAEISE